MYVGLSIAPFPPSLQAHGEDDEGEHDTMMLDTSGEASGAGEGGEGGDVTYDDLEAEEAEEEEEEEEEEEGEGGEETEEDELDLEYEYEDEDQITEDYLHDLQPFGWPSECASLSPFPGR